MSACFECVWNSQSAAGRKKINVFMQLTLEMRYCGAVSIRADSTLNVEHRRRRQYNDLVLLFKAVSRTYFACRQHRQDESNTKAVEKNPLFPSLLTLPFCWPAHLCPLSSPPCTFCFTAPPFLPSFSSSRSKLGWGLSNANLTRNKMSTASSCLRSRLRVFCVLRAAERNENGDVSCGSWRRCGGRRTTTKYSSANTYFINGNRKVFFHKRTNNISSSDGN